MHNNSTEHKTVFCMGSNLGIKTHAKKKMFDKVRQHRQNSKVLQVRIYSTGMTFNQDSIPDFKKNQLFCCLLFFLHDWQISFITISYKYLSSNYVTHTRDRMVWVTCQSALQFWHTELSNQKAIKKGSTGFLPCNKTLIQTSPSPNPLQKTKHLSGLSMKMAVMWHNHKVRQADYGCLIARKSNSSSIFL